MNKLTKRIIMSTFGVILSGISVGIFKFSAFGVDPFQSLMSGLDAVIPIKFGTLYVITNVVLLIAVFLLDRKKIGAATFINLFLLGYIAEFSQSICGKIMPDISLGARVAVFLFAIVLLSFSSSLYFTSNLGVSTYDAISLVWSCRQKKIKFSYCRMICDLVCVMLGVILMCFAGFNLLQISGSVGIGTIITAFFMGPLIEFFNIHVSRPILGI